MGHPVDHMLVSFTALRDKRKVLDTYIHDQTADNLPLRAVIANEMSSTTTNTVQFLLDPSVTPKFILEKMYAITRTYCYALHRSAANRKILLSVIYVQFKHYILLRLNLERL